MATAKKNTASKAKTSKSKTKTAAPAKKSKSTTSRAAPKADLEPRKKASARKPSENEQESQVAKKETAIRQAEAAEPGAEVALHEASQEGESSFRDESVASTPTSTRKDKSGVQKANKVEESEMELEAADQAEDEDQPQVKAGAKEKSKWVEGTSKAVAKRSGVDEERRAEVASEGETEKAAASGKSLSDESLITADKYASDSEPGHVSSPKSKQTSKHETIDQAGESARMIDATAQTPQIKRAGATASPEDLDVTPSANGKGKRPSASQEGESALSAKEAINAAREAISSARIALNSAKDALLAATKDVPAEDKKSLLQELSGTLKNFVSSVRNHDSHP